MSRSYAIFFLSFLVFSLSCKKDNLEDLSKGEAQTMDWMQDLMEKYDSQSISLKDISMPRAHDAGVYVLNTCTGGNDCNTQTQDLNMQGMLEAGIRVFDLRPALLQGEYWTYHRAGCGGLGCEGATLQSFLAETKNFLDNHKELVILEIGHLCNTSSQDQGLINLFESQLGNRIFTLDSPLSQPFIQTPLDEIIPKSASGGKVVLLFADLNSSNEQPSLGLFSEGFIPISGSYSNSIDIDYVIADQEQKFQNFNPSSNQLFKVSYTFTLNVANMVACLSNREAATSIEEVTLEARPRMSATFDQWISSGLITANKIPNIVSVDFCNTAVTQECIRLSELSLD